MRRARETAMLRPTRSRPIPADGTDDQTLERAVTVRHRADEHFRRTAFSSDRSNEVVASKHLARVEHANAVRAVRTMEYHGSGKRATAILFARDVTRERSPAGSTSRVVARVRTVARLDAIDRARSTSAKLT